MNITSLIENTSHRGLPVEHGLSLYIESRGKHILFDMGQSTLFAENAERLGVSIRDVDVAVVSHGHYDHGVGLQTFLSFIDKLAAELMKYDCTQFYTMHCTGETGYNKLKAIIGAQIEYLSCGDKIEI